MRWFKSPAKINRFLYIKGKLPNGYHEIFTLFEKIELFDEIGIFITSNNKEIKINCPTWLSKGPDNLIYKAVCAFKEKTGLNFGVSIDLKKNIPAGGGLGGGSSNCATTLKALNELFDNPLRKSELIEIASRLGADCAFFATDFIQAFGEGTGTELRECQVSPNWYLLVFPDFSVSTRWAYENFKLTRHKCVTIFERRKERLENIWQNDLEEPVCAKYPIINRVKDGLLSLGARAALMSGSGSTVFGVFENKEEALWAKDKIIKDLGFEARVTRTLDRSFT